MTDPLDYMEIRRGLPNNAFGMVRNNGTRPHQGWDLWAPNGTPVYAIAAGQVEFVKLNSGDYGSQVCVGIEDPISPGNLLYVFYAHLSQIYVTAQSWVEEGQLIALSGDTGNAAGFGIADQHLHFEIRTLAQPGRGLTDRLDPAVIFGYDLLTCSDAVGAPVCPIQ